MDLNRGARWHMAPERLPGLVGWLHVRQRRRHPLTARGLLRLAQTGPPPDRLRNGGKNTADPLLSDVSTVRMPPPYHHRDPTATPHAEPLRATPGSRDWTILTNTRLQGQQLIALGTCAQDFGPGTALPSSVQTPAAAGRRGVHHGLFKPSAARPQVVYLYSASILQ
jgi:hypothetical protein